MKLHLRIDLKLAHALLLQSYDRELGRYGKQLFFSSPTITRLVILVAEMLAPFNVINIANS